MNDLVEAANKDKNKQAKTLECIHNDISMLRADLKRHWFWGRVFSMITIVKDFIVVYLMVMGLIYMPEETKELFNISMNTIKGIL